MSARDTSLVAFASMHEMVELGKLLAQSGFFNDTRGAAQAVVKILAGRELGFGPIASMTGVYVIKGRVTLSANLMAAAVKRSGRYDYRLKVLDDDQCTIEFLEGETSLGESTFTTEDAKAAQLAGDNWKKFPRNMLFARALSNGAKWYCPDIFGGSIYTPEELGAAVDEDGQVIEVDAERVGGYGDLAGADSAPRWPSGENGGSGAESDGGESKSAEPGATLWATMKADLAERVPVYRDAHGRPDARRIKQAARNLGYSGVPADEEGMRALIAALEREAESLAVA